MPPRSTPAGGDITDLWTWEGWLYLATVIDIASRRVVGFALAESCSASLKGECLDQQPWPTRAAARRATVEYIAW
ncbi:MAG TPA: hypothetical protein VHM23_04570 [Actinomycetota bacterium]|jgi:transposase InsO family protein|nr:hypothetical protein [Actinomycetota bacterium]